MIELEIKDIVTMVTAMTGAGLGIYNWFHMRAQDRVNLKVVPKASWFRGRGLGGREYYLSHQHKYPLEAPNPPDTLSLEIINLSKFPVTVDEVGLKPRWSGHRMAMPSPILPDQGEWPRRLEPRETVTVRFDPTELVASEIIESVSRAYASTACGSTCYGTSGALKEFLSIARAIRNAPEQRAQE
jgi:hypothetical protein